MPYRTEWTEPDIFLTHKGVTVWHCYKDDDYDRRLAYWYTVTEVDPAEGHEGSDEFDVRELKTYSLDLDDRPDLVIMAAIETGELKQEQETE